MVNLKQMIVEVPHQNATAKTNLDLCFSVAIKEKNHFIHQLQVHYLFTSLNLMVFSTFRLNLMKLNFTISVQIQNVVSDKEYSREIHLQLITFHCINSIELNLQMSLKMPTFGLKNQTLHGPQMTHSHHQTIVEIGHALLLIMLFSSSRDSLKMVMQSVLYK